MARKKPNRLRARRGITEKEVRDVEEMSTPRTPVIYEVIRRQGVEELARPASSLWWSGVAGGLSISFSLLAMAILETHLPEAGWRVLVTSLGYTIGFLIVILGRQQLFTESTITAVLPVLKDTTLENLWQVARLWAIVLAANLTGTLFAAIFCSFAPVLPSELLESMRSISRYALNGHSWWEMVFDGVSSGFLMAAMVWMIPAAEMLKVVRHRADDLADRGRRLHPYRRRQRRGFPAAGCRRVVDRHPALAIPGAGADRQHHRRHGAVRACCPTRRSRKRSSAGLRYWFTQVVM